MRIAIVHGYYLHDSGSGVYVRELAHELVRQGHEVTLVCQERSPELYDFIDEASELRDDNRELRPLGLIRPPLHEGRGRLVRPHLSRLLVYVEGPFPGFERDRVTAFHHSSPEWLEEYAQANIQALRTAFAAWPPDVVLANHAMMQPYIVRQALGGAAPYVATVHGSELNFSVKNDPRLVPYTLEGLEAAAAVVTVSADSGQDVVAWARREGLEIGSRTHTVTPGVDMRTFSPAPDRESALSALRRDVPLPEGYRPAPEDRIIAYAGRLMWTKGIQHAVAALPLIAARFSADSSRVHLFVAGEGPAQAPLERLAALLRVGDQEAALALAASEIELQTLPDFGPVVSPTPPVVSPSPLGPRGRADAWSLAFLGHLTSAQLGRVFAAADISLAPSVFPEAVGLVTTEALAAGALPIATYHSGLASVVDVVADSLGDPALKGLTSGRWLTEGLARLVVHALEHYPTADPVFRSRLSELCRLRFPSWEQVARRYLELARGG